MTRPWLLHDSEFDRMSAYGDDCMTLWDNGIITESLAEFQFIICYSDEEVLPCPQCESIVSYKCERGDWACKLCKTKFSVTTRRYMDNSNLSLGVWWRFCYLVGQMKITNSCTIAKDLNVTQKTAWQMLRRLKDSMKDSGHVFKNGSIDVKHDLECRSFLMRIAKSPYAYLDS